MSDPKDIVDKADAFLGRYRSGDVPVLTDVVGGPDAPPPAAESAGPATAPLSEPQLREIERQVTQRVLEAIQPALAELLEPALRGLTEQIKAQAEAFVRAAVANALERELRQLRPPRG
jgi:hypothetical protein